MSDHKPAASDVATDAIGALFQEVAPTDQPAAVTRWVIVAERSDLEGSSLIHFQGSDGNGYVDNLGLLAAGLDILRNSSSLETD